MFDISFWELALIAVVALVVIGPERLPGVARTVGKWVGGAQRFVRSVKADIDAEINKNEDLKSLLEEQEELKSTHKMLENTIGDLKEPVSVPRRSTPAGNTSLGKSDNKSVDTAVATAVDNTAPAENSAPEVLSETVKPVAPDNKQSNG